MIPFIITTNSNRIQSLFASRTHTIAQESSHSKLTKYKISTYRTYNVEIRHTCRLCLSELPSCHREVRPTVKMTLKRENFPRKFCPQIQLIHKSHRPLITKSEYYPNT